MKTKTTILFAVAVVGAVSLARPAWASHKAWVIKNGGADCSFYDPGNADYVSGYFTNYTAVARSVTCPLTLSGRWGSSDSPLFAPARWGAALSANVYINKGSDLFYCYAVGQSDVDSVYYSATAIAGGSAGPQTLVVAGQNNWGGDLETNQHVVMRALGFGCNLPGSGANGSSAIFGYKAKICQWQPNCADLQTPPHDTVTANRGGTNIVQNNGFECSPQESWDVPHLTRNFDGIKNTSTNGTRAAVVCPLSPPADDGYEHGRQVTAGRVYYKGGATDANCVANRTCPECYFEWYDRVGGWFQSSVFTVQAGAGALKGTLANTSQEVQTSMRCWLPPGVTLNGNTAYMSVSQVSNSN